MRPLEGKIALVAGATRGAGRGIATALGESGATVWCTGRSTRADADRRATGEARPAGAAAFELARRPETIEETAAQVTAAGGTGVAYRVDHTDEAQVVALMARIAERHGRLDVLVNDVWGGDELAEWGKPAWELDPTKGFAMVDRVMRTHVLTLRHAVPHLRGGPGLVVEVTDGDFLGYRGNLFYDLAKMIPIRLAFGLAADLQASGGGGAGGITAVAITPGFLRSEAMLDHLGVTEATWREAIAADPYFAESETPRFVSRAVAALAADPDVARKAGRMLSSWALAREYGFDDVDGRRPHWGEFLDRNIAALLAQPGPLPDDQRWLVLARYQQLMLDPTRAAFTGELAARLGLDT